MCDYVDLYVSDGDVCLMETCICVLQHVLPGSTSGIQVAMPVARVLLTARGLTTVRSSVDVRATITVTSKTISLRHVHVRNIYSQHLTWEVYSCIEP